HIDSSLTSLPAPSLVPVLSRLPPALRRPEYPGLPLLWITESWLTYAIRRIRDAFRENKNIKDSEEIEELVNKAKANLEIIHRQVTIGQLYSTEKLVIESPGNT
ncbi:LYR motif-containing protein 4, partial [Apteryx rowi]|uniref:LYR motif-containing protein 4 n=1 Tax=Apteryx rowi TaxID=308060 RepID=UPI000E1DD960